MSCSQSDRVDEAGLGALSPAERIAFEAHLATCAECRQRSLDLGVVVASFVAWPTDVLRPSSALRERLSHRIAGETGGEPAPAEPSSWVEPEWEHVAPGISVKILATDEQRGVVSMLVRLAPGGEYPAHTHAGLEELHLLEGELWIDERKLRPGDFNRAEAGSADARVWSETGCTCVLVTSTRDRLA